MTKIAYFLFPENIPDITLSAMSPNSMGRKKTDFGKDHKVMWVDPYHHPLIPPAVSLKEIRIAEENIGNNEGVAAFIKAMAEVGLEPDGYIRNFGVDDKGVVKYADSFNAFVIVEDKGADDEIFARTFDAEKLKEAIDRLDEKNKKRAREYYDRLIRIVEDAERKWTKHIQREN
ncbi:MAG: hypothetical protein Q8P56_03195 [Candidatus Uhrbacteria bacterium]|nr:hypothetical protein [Candidatus Uhrbacteria bacterium]